MLDKLANHSRILRERSGWIGPRQSPALGFGGGLKILLEVLGGKVHRDAPSPELPLELRNR